MSPQSPLSPRPSACYPKGQQAHPGNTHETLRVDLLLPLFKVLPQMWRERKKKTELINNVKYLCASATSSWETHQSHN